MHVTVIEITYAILCGAVAYTVFDERRQARRRRRQYSQDDVDRLAAEHRDDPPQTVAWPPGTGLHVTAGEQPCGCQVATTPDGAHIITCPAHDPEFVSEWEQRLSQ